LGIHSFLLGSVSKVINPKKYQVLFAEDNSNDIFLMERAIRKASLPIQLHLVRNGEEAVSYLRGEGEFGDRTRYPLPMLVLSNMKMPKMNGLELLRWIRQQPEFESVPVVVMSSSEDPGEAKEFSALEVNSYTIKPVAQVDLIELLQQAIALLPPLQ
jgi:CheY-like chemotaxis protein